MTWNASPLPQRVLDGDQVYILNDSLVTAQTVEILGMENGDAIIGGLEDNQVVLDEGIKNIASGTDIKEIALD